MRKAIDVLLLLLAIGGGILAWRSGQERRRLAAVYDRLSHVTGELEIADPSKVHLIALETGEPLHFAWRVYLPPNYSLSLFQGSAGDSFSSSSWSSGPAEFIARVRFRQDENGQLEVYARYSGGSSRGGAGSLELGKLLRGRWDRVVVEQLGTAGLTTLERGQSAVVLRLSLPDDLAKEARKTMPPGDRERLVPVFYQFKLGPTGTQR